MNFHLPFLSSLLSLFFFSCPSNIEIIFDFSGIITKIHPPFQNPGSTLAYQPCTNKLSERVSKLEWCKIESMTENVLKLIIVKNAPHITTKAPTIMMRNKAPHIISLIPT